MASARAASGPTAKDVFEAAKAAGLEPVLEDEHHHPAAWFERGGRVLIPDDSAKNKRAAIDAVAGRIRGIVDSRPDARRPRKDKARKGRFSSKRRRRRHR